MERCIFSTPCFRSRWSKKFGLVLCMHLGLHFSFKVNTKVVWSWPLGNVPWNDVGFLWFAICQAKFLCCHMAGCNYKVLGNKGANSLLTKPWSARHWVRYDGWSRFLSQKSLHYSKGFQEFKGCTNSVSLPVLQEVPRLFCPRGFQNNYSFLPCLLFLLPPPAMS